MLPHYLLHAERGLERVHVTGSGVDADFDSIFGIWRHCMEIPYFSTLDRLYDEAGEQYCNTIVYSSSLVDEIRISIFREQRCVGG